MLKRFLFGGLGVAIMVLLPTATAAQFSLASTGTVDGITCHDRCYQAWCGGHYVGAGPDPGTNQNVCSVGGCTSGPCAAEEDAEDTQAEFEAAVAALLSAESADELRALVDVHGDRLLLNEDRGQVVVMAGCTLAPAVLVRVGAPQMAQLAEMTSSRLEGYFALRELERTRAGLAVDGPGS